MNRFTGKELRTATEAGGYKVMRIKCDIRGVNVFARWLPLGALEYNRWRFNGKIINVDWWSMQDLLIQAANKQMEANNG
ncbi:MAG: hypothetical protein ACR2N8_01190 [Parvibaculales bacterium]